MPTPTLIGVHGFAGSGKDTAAEVLIAENGYVREAFADSLRAAAVRMDPIIVSYGHVQIRLASLVTTYGWDHVKRSYPEARRVLQRLGTEVLRDTFGTAVHHLMLAKWLDEHERLVITDVRFPDEADAILAAGGEVWHVVRPGVGPANDHPSEHAMIGYPRFTRTLDNDGTIADLHAQVRAAVAAHALVTS